VGALRRCVSTVRLSQHPRAVLWDVDGTLIDSAEYHWLTWREVLSREGYDLARNQFKASFGQRNDEILRSYFGPDLPATAIERIGTAKEELYRKTHPHPRHQAAPWCAPLG
jgi:beta-phosphoglucomutase-like phosphatase (HAD superfamily)